MQLKLKKKIIITRINQHDKKFLQRVKTSLGQQKLEFRGVKIWNNLPTDIKNVNSLT